MSLNTDPQKILRVGLTALFLIISIIATITILNNPTGGIAGLSKMITILSILLGLGYPKMGLLFLVLQATYVDQMKRLGAYYGATSMQTVQEILIGPLITLTCINVGYFYRVIRGQYRFGKMGLFLYLLIAIVTLGMFIGGQGGSSAMLRIYNSTTISLYITLIPLCYGMFDDMEEWVKYISLQAIVAAPAAAWGIWQYYNGFSTMEWAYAETGLSPTHSIQMLMFEDPRIFGFFGSASAYGCVGVLAIFTTWRTFARRDRRWLYAALAILYVACILYSRQRTIAVLYILSFVVAYIFRRKSTTLVAYVGSLFLFIVVVGNARWIREVGILEINKAIQTEGRLGATLDVSTFSDRLVGWERLTRAESWSLLGDIRYANELANAETLRDDERNHDVINKVLIKYGAVGVIITISLGVIVFYVVHRFVLRAPTTQLRKDGAFILGTMVPIIGLSFAGGSNYSTTPINLETWSVLSGVFVIYSITKRHQQADQAAMVPNEVEAAPLAHPNPSQISHRGS